MLTDRQTDRQAERQANRQADMTTGRQKKMALRQAGRQTDIDSQAGRQTDGHVHLSSCSHVAGEVVVGMCDPVRRQITVTNMQFMQSQVALIAFSYLSLSVSQSY